MRRNDGAMTTGTRINQAIPVASTGLQSAACMQSHASSLACVIYSAEFSGDQRNEKTFGIGVEFVCSVADRGQTIAIRAGNLIDPAKGSISKNQIVLVQYGKITALGGSLAIPQNAQEIYPSPEAVGPGPSDAHTHVTLTEKPGQAPIGAYNLEGRT